MQAKPKRSKKPPASKASKAIRTAPTAAARGVTRAVAAAALGVPGNRISQWVSDGAPVVQRGHRGEANLYDVEALRAWKEARLQETAGALSLEEERAKLAREQRRKLEREGRIKAGELVERDDVIAETKSGVLAARTRFLQLPRQMGQAGIITREQEPAVKALVDDALRELSNWHWTKPDAATDAA